jgi:hypothetical protein
MITRYKKLLTFALLGSSLLASSNAYSYESERIRTIEKKLDKAERLVETAYYNASGYAYWSMWLGLLLVYFMHDEWQSTGRAYFSNSPVTCILGTYNLVNCALNAFLFRKALRDREFYLRELELLSRLRDNPQEPDVSPQE